MRNLVLVILMSWCYSLQGQDITLPIPTNLTAKLEQVDKRYYVRLSWDGRQVGDTLTESYFLFNNYPPSEKLFLNGVINRLSDTTYLYEIKKPYAAEYHFSVRANSYFPLSYKSELSDTVSILVPSRDLPFVKNLAGSIQGEILSISWEYASIMDLEGFVITFGERKETVSADQRSFEVNLDEEMVSGLMVSVLAYSRNGVQSANRKIIVSEGQKEP